MGLNGAYIGTVDGTVFVKFASNFNCDHSHCYWQIASNVKALLALAPLVMQQQTDNTFCCLADQGDKVR